MFDLVQTNPVAQISPSTVFSVGNFKEMPDFSSTAFFWWDDTGKFRVLPVPTEHLPLLVERNAQIFAQKVFSLWISNLSEESLYDHLNPLKNGPVNVILFIDSLFQGRYWDIHFDLSAFMGGWWRQFQDEGYKALEIFLELQAKEHSQKDLGGSWFMDGFKNFHFDILNQALIQRFIEWDGKRYLFAALQLDNADGQDIQKIHVWLREYIKTIKNSSGKEILWRVLHSVQNDSFFSAMGNEIRVDFLDGVWNIGAEKAFDAIIENSLEELCLLEADHIEKWLRENLSEKASQKLREIVLSAYQDNSGYIQITWLSESESENLCMALYNFWKAKKWQKNKILKELFEWLMDTVSVRENILKPETLAYALNILPKNKKLENILQVISVENFVIIFDTAEWDKKKTYLLKLCKIQLKEVYARVTSGDTVSYARIIHFIASGKSADATDIFFGMSWLLVSANKSIAGKKSLFLPYEKPKSIVSRIWWAVTDLVLSNTQKRIVQSKILWAMSEGIRYKESLLYDFHKDFYPIGAKIHFSEPITPDQVAILHQIVGFWSTPFKLLHADTSLCLPACQSPIQLIAILHRLVEMRIVSDDTLEFQLTMAGRVSNEMAGVVGSVCLFSKIQPVSYPRSTFVTSHNDVTGTCIICYDAGVLDTHNFPNLPPHISGRTDMLGFKNPMEVITYFLVSNLISQHIYGSPLSSIGERFIQEYKQLLYLHGTENILQAKWVHNPDKINTPFEEEEHFAVVKDCTDTLWKDIGSYNSHGDANGLSFAVKNLLYRYIIEHRLLPLDQEWAKKYLSYFKYEQRQLASKETTEIHFLDS